MLVRRALEIPSVVEQQLEGVERRKEVLPVADEKVDVRKRFEPSRRDRRPFGIALDRNDTSSCRSHRLGPFTEGRSGLAGAAAGSEDGEKPMHLGYRRPAVCHARRRYCTSCRSLNIGRYIAMMMIPTIAPTPSIISGSTIEVSDWIEVSTSSS